MRFTKIYDEKKTDKRIEGSKLEIETTPRTMFYKSFTNNQVEFKF